MTSILALNSVMVAGVNTRPIVKSAKALGLKTVAVDSFGDLDLSAYADDLFSLKPKEPTPEGFKRQSLSKISLRALETHEVDAILLGSGIEHDFGSLKNLGEKAEIIGNEVASIRLCEDKEKLFRVADELGIPHPMNKRARDLADALKAAEDIGYPVVLKPAFGGGGIGVELARSPEEVERSFKIALRAGDGKSPYVQKYIQGVDASTSVLSNGDEARRLTVNEQIIGERRLGSPRPFGYCGNVIPFSGKKELVSKMAEFAEALCRRIGLVGSNGIDFVVSDQPYLMEINPRFQSTIDCVEGLLGINLVGEHIKACGGELGNYGRPDGHSVKLILYAERNLEVPDLTKFRDVVDIPWKGSVVRKGKPLCCILKFGKRRPVVLKDAYVLAKEVRNFSRGVLP